MTEREILVLAQRVYAAASYAAGRELGPGFVYSVTGMDSKGVGPVLIVNLKALTEAEADLTAGPVIDLLEKSLPTPITFQFQDEDLVVKLP